MPTIDDLRAEAALQIPRIDAEIASLAEFKDRVLKYNEELRTRSGASVKLMETVFPGYFDPHMWMVYDTPYKGTGEINNYIYHLNEHKNDFKRIAGITTTGGMERRIPPVYQDLVKSTDDTIARSRLLVNKIIRGTSEPGMNGMLYPVVTSKIGFNVFKDAFTGRRMKGVIDNTMVEPSMELILLAKHGFVNDEHATLIDHESLPITVLDKMVERIDPVEYSGSRTELVHARSSNRIAEMATRMQLVRDRMDDDYDRALERRWFNDAFPPRIGKYEKKKTPWNDTGRIDARGRMMRASRNALIDAFPATIGLQMCSWIGRDTIKDHFMIEREGSYYDKERLARTLIDMENESLGARKKREIARAEFCACSNDDKPSEANQRNNPSTYGKNPCTMESPLFKDVFGKIWNRHFSGSRAFKFIDRNVD